jgi:hypothetical protein
MRDTEQDSTKNPFTAAERVAALSSGAERAAALIAAERVAALSGSADRLGTLHSIRRPSSMRQRAVDDLGFIRATMERAASYRAVPGWGGMRMGFVALAATPFAISAATPSRWLMVWALAAILGGSIGAFEMFRKAHFEGVSLLTGAGSRFAKALAPGLITGGLLTIVLRQIGPMELLPAVWLLCYGTAVVGAGAHSIRAVRSMGLSFMLVGALALLGVVFAPDKRLAGDVCMALGFGLLHVVFGIGIGIARDRDG